MIASLNMYDWPEYRAEIDQFWSTVARNLATAGIDAPARLDRKTPAYVAWLSADLLVSQTCGLPFVRSLRGRVRLVGAVDHGLPDVPAGHYCSRIVVRQGDPAATMADLRGRRAAYNSTDSQSGAGALRHIVLPMLDSGRFFGEARATGDHAASIRAVAEGRADVAAIDAVTWVLAQRHLPEAVDLRVLASTPATPGLPLITAADGPADALRQAMASAADALSPARRTALQFHKILPRADADFDIVARWDAKARAAGYTELDDDRA